MGSASAIDASVGCVNVMDAETEFCYLSVVAQPASDLATLSATPQPLCNGGTGAVYAWLGPASFAAARVAPSIPNVTTANDSTYVATADRNGQRVVTSLYVPVTPCLATFPGKPAAPLAIYPNPTTGLCTLQFPAQLAGQVVHAVVRNATGHVIGEYELHARSGNTSPVEASLDRRGKATGLYFVEVRTEQGPLFAKVAVE